VSVATKQEVDSLLERLAVPRSVPSAQLLRELQRAWGLCQPFHNLDLLEGYAAGRPPLDRRGGWLRCVDGLGGPCHVQASSFLCLLRAVGFDAHFGSATISHPGDHLVVICHVGGRTWLCDVGNGHPYLEPFPFDEPATAAHLGWVMRTDVTGAGLLLEQRTPGAGRWRRVYVASHERREWSDFAAAIERHHREVGFGPFLTGLRAVRIGTEVAWTLRDDVLTAHRAEGSQQRTLADEHEEILRSTLALGALPVEVAVATWRSNREAAA